jgi:hypothetical protein
MGVKTMRFETVSGKFKLATFLVFMLMMSSAWALDADDEDDKDKAEVATSSTEVPEPPAHPSTEQNHPDAQGHKTGCCHPKASLAEQATDPSAILTQLGFFFWTESSSDDKNIANTGLFQPVLPLSKKNVLRPALPIISTGGSDGEFGIGDLFLLDVNISHVATGSFGWGAVASLPTATDDTLGSGKWQAGPMIMYMNKTLPKDLFGILAYNEWSFAGDSDRQKVNKFSFQPIWVHHTSWGYIGWTDLTATIDWENDNRFSFPVGLRFGKVFKAKTPLNVYVQPYYTFNNRGKDDVWGIKLSATFIKPGWLKH